jgi:hypothetical protein
MVNTAVRRPNSVTLITRQEEAAWHVDQQVIDLATAIHTRIGVERHGRERGLNSGIRKKPCSGSRGGQVLAKVTAEEADLVPQQVLGGGFVADPVRGTG